MRDVHRGLAWCYRSCKSLMDMHQHATHLAAGKLVGDALLAAAFVSYAGPFNMQFRKRLVTEKWLPDLIERVIPMTTGVMPLDMLASDSSKVQPSCLPSLALQSCQQRMHPCSGGLQIAKMDQLASALLDPAAHNLPMQRHSLLGPTGLQLHVVLLLQAKWSNEGLMTDALSVENGAIMTNASRWSLMIDPQLQGIKWIINKELANGLKIIQQSQAKYIDTVRHWFLYSCRGNA